MVVGLEKRSWVLSDCEKKIVVYYEVGYVLVAVLMFGSGKVEKILIVLRGMVVLGYIL